jgi:hypothetical protein
MDGSHDARLSGEFRAVKRLMCEVETVTAARRLTLDLGGSGRTADVTKG